MEADNSRILTPWWRMSDDWLCGVQIPMTLEQFHLLPRNPAYAYEFIEGIAYLSPRPRYYHAVLDLEPAPVFEHADDKTLLRPIRDDDWEPLAKVFAAAFRDQPPFGHLPVESRIIAGQKSLSHTRAGGDGPLLSRASLVAVDENGRACGALLVTLFPAGDPSSLASYHWAEPPPIDAVERRIGRPHITWVFVAPQAGGQGLGTAMLRAAVAELRGLGYRELGTTFMFGNISSLLWHWRMGFRLVSYPFSRRVPPPWARSDYDK